METLTPYGHQSTHLRALPNETQATTVQWDFLQPTDLK